MNAIRNVWNAFANLASAVNGLAEVVQLATGRLRQQLALDGERAAPVLEHNGEGIDATAEDGSPATKRGRKSA